MHYCGRARALSACGACRTHEAAVMALRMAAVTMVAVLGSFGVTYALAQRLSAGASAAILAAALCVGLMRRNERRDARSLVVTLLTLPLVAVAAGAIGLMIRAAPVLGAIAFCSGIAISIVLRNYGKRASAIGRTLALPLLTVLVVPVQLDAGGAKLVPALLMVAAGLIAFACATIVLTAAE